MGLKTSWSTETPCRDAQNSTAARAVKRSLIGLRKCLPVIGFASNAFGAWRETALASRDAVAKTPPFHREDFLSGRDSGRVRLIRAQSGLRWQGEETGNRRRSP